MKINRAYKIVKALTLTLALLLSNSAIAQEAQDHWIEHIRGSVYYAHHKWNNSIYNSIFMVTDQGIILVDPINPDAAKWLKEELKNRFDQPVRYIIYSHHHFDHAPGAEVFSDSVYEVIAQESFEENLKADTFKIKAKVMPTRTYEGRMELSLGTKKVELLDLTSNHSSDSTIVRFPDEKIIFTVDLGPAGRVAWRYFGGYSVEDSNDFGLALTDMETIMALDFDIIAPGHYDYKTLKDLRRTYEYHIDLCKRVAMEMEAGSDLAQILETVTMADYIDLKLHDRFVAMNVEGMHYQLTRHSPDVRCRVKDAP